MNINEFIVSRLNQPDVMLPAHCETVGCQYNAHNEKVREVTICSYMEPVAQVWWAKHAPVIICAWVTTRKFSVTTTKHTSIALAHVAMLSNEHTPSFPILRSSTVPKSYEYCLVQCDMQLNAGLKP